LRSDGGARTCRHARARQSSGSPNCEQPPARQANLARRQPTAASRRVTRRGSRSVGKALLRREQPDEALAVLDDLVGDVEDLRGSQLTALRPTGRGHYEIAADQPRNLRLPVAFRELAKVI